MQVAMQCWPCKRSKSIVDVLEYKVLGKEQGNGGQADTLQAAADKLLRCVYLISVLGKQLYM